MASVEKRGNKWRARASIGGRLVAAGSWDTRSEALQAALEKERMAKAGNTAGAHGKRVRDLLERYAERVSTGKRGRRWEVVTDTPMYFAASRRGSSGSLLETCAAMRRSTFSAMTSASLSVSKEIILYWPLRHKWTSVSQ